MDKRLANRKLMESLKQNLVGEEKQTRTLSGYAFNKISTIFDVDTGEGIIKADGKVIAKFESGGGGTTSVKADPKELTDVIMDLIFAHAK